MTESPETYFELDIAMSLVLLRSDYLGSPVRPVLRPLLELLFDVPNQRSWLHPDIQGGRD